MATVGTAVQAIPEFGRTFEALTGHKPYPWQETLFREFLIGFVPANINLPSGTGKTSIIAIWLIALCRQASVGTIVLPRRLVWVVNRRVVVDQATDDVVNIRRRLNSAVTSGLKWLRSQIQLLGASQDEILAISTLRGEHEDDKEWSKDPSRPAVIIGTVDMIGSRLLFSGYGDSRYWRAQYAGLLGQDSLIVNDEAHLTPAFASLLTKIEALQNGSLKPFRTIRLSATLPTADCWPKSLERDRADQHFRRVFEATKRLFIRTVQSARVEQTIIDLASERGTGRTVVFVTAPVKAQKIAAAIRKHVGPETGQHVLTLTGTMRGFERDQLVAKQEFEPFAGKTQPTDDYWLVSTPAGEVGINISADRLITGCNTLDRLIQRFGRLNRFGETDGVGYLIAGDKEKDQRAEALNVLTTQFSGNETDGYDISPKALFGFPLDENACSPRPNQAALHPWHIDVWSQTSLGGHPARPEVEPWLHGQEQCDERETYVAWRNYTNELANSELFTNEDLEELLEEYPLLAHEQLREPTVRLVEKLNELFQGDRAKKVIRRKCDGSVDIITLPKIETKFGIIDIREDRSERTAIRELAYAHLVFPPGCGRPVHGMFEPKWLQDDEPEDSEIIGSTPYDVSGAIWRRTSSQQKTRRELRAAYCAERQGDGKYFLRRFGGFPNTEYQLEPIESLERKEIDQFAVENEFRFVFQIRLRENGCEDSTEKVLLFFGPSRTQRSVSDRPLFISDHNRNVSSLAERLGAALELSTEIVNALSLSGGNHDLGKGRDIWQRAAGNFDRNTRQRRYLTPIAKSLGVMQGRQLAGFRHELASLLDVTKLKSTDISDLLLHLIAAHHGHARPCFLTKSYDRENLRDSAREALETAQRFAHLERKYGPWGLAYLEAILRAADGIASAQAAEQSPHA